MKIVLFFRHPELVSGSIVETAQRVKKWMLKQVQHEGLPGAIRSGGTQHGEVVDA
jgi:hypothetical protein